MLDGVLAGSGAPDPDPDPDEVRRLPRLDQRADAAIASRRAAAAEAEAAEGEVDVVVDHDHVGGRYTEGAHKVGPRSAAEIHEGGGASEDDVESVDGAGAHLGGPLAPRSGEPAPALQLVEDHPPAVVPGAGVLASGIAQADDQRRHGSRGINAV